MTPLTSETRALPIIGRAAVLMWRDKALWRFFTLALMLVAANFLLFPRALTDVSHLPRHSPKYVAWILAQQVMFIMGTTAFCRAALARWRKQEWSLSDITSTLSGNALSLAVLAVVGSLDSLVTLPGVAAIAWRAGNWLLGFGVVILAQEVHTLPSFLGRLWALTKVAWWFRLRGAVWFLLVMAAVLAPAAALVFLMPKLNLELAGELSVVAVSIMALGMFPVFAIWQIFDVAAFLLATQDPAINAPGSPTQETASLVSPV